VVGLENVLKAAKRTTTVKKIVYTSSYFAIGPTDGYIADETQVQYELFFLSLSFPGCTTVNKFVLAQQFSCSLTPVLFEVHAHNLA
jgi:hypothetical protein